MPDSLQSQLNECAFAFDLDEHKFLFISPNITDVLGYSAADFYQNINLLYEIIDPQQRDSAKMQTAKLTEGGWIDLHYQIKTALGEEKRVHERKSLIADPHSGHKVLLSTIKNHLPETIDNKGISDSQLYELSFLFDNNPNPMLIYETTSLHILKVNKAAIERYGYTEREFLTMTSHDLMRKMELEKFNDQLYKNGTNEPTSDGVFHSGIWKHQNKKGELIYSDITSQKVKFENRDCRVVVAADGTEKIRYQEEAIWTKNNLEALINNTEDQIWSLDKEARYVYMNNAYRVQIARVTGFEPKEGDYSYLHPGYSIEIIEAWKQYYNRALAGERYSIINESIDPLTQKVLSYEVSFNPIYKLKHDITGVGCFARNITESIATEKAIIDQNERLRHIASLTSHELRRPVASMLGLINIMDRVNFFNPDNQEIIEHLLTVGKEIDEVIRLIIDKSFIDDLSKNKYQLP